MLDAATLTPREEQDRRIAVSLKRQLGEFARHVGADGVTDLMLNPDGTVWVHRAGQGKEMVGRMAASAAEAFIATVASTLRTTVTRDNPILECELPADAPFFGARIEALIPPFVSAPSWAIRFKAVHLYTLDDYVAGGIMTIGQRAALRWAAMERRNVIVSGGTGSGKTTLLNALLAEIAVVSRDHRIAIIQDTDELQCAAADVVAMRSNATVGQQQALKATMRLMPDRIVVGEVRGREALDMLKAWNTGHDGGASTVHANSAVRALLRIEQLIQEVSMAPQREQIAAAVNLVVHIARIGEPPGRRVTEIVAVRGYADGQYQLETVG